MNKINTQRCKGARDLLPADTDCFRALEDMFRICCTKWGYQEVRTPTLEYLHLFTASGTLTPDMLSKVYSFLDWDGWSGERIVLRPDGTIPVVRLFVENLLKQKMARLFYVTNVFSFEGTGKDNRERWQFGVELFGKKQPASDVEIILLALFMLHSAGLGKLQVDLSHAGLLKALVKELKLSPEKETLLLMELRDGNWKAITKSKIADRDLNKILSLLVEMKGRTSGFLENLRALPNISGEIKSEIDNFLSVTKILDNSDIQYQIDLTSTTGYEYYTGLCFQFTIDDIKICSGGRYDDLVPLIGNAQIPACGFAMHIDHLMKRINPQSNYPDNQKVVVSTMLSDPGAVAECFKIAQLVREQDYLVEVGFNCNTSCNRWTISVQNDSNIFTVIDNQSNKTFSASTISKALDIMRSLK
jgi:histidyl-tRNA synthetase